MKIYTKAGDQGDTGLLGGRRISKDDLRVEAYGTVDELNAQLGQARAVCDAACGLESLLTTLQALLFELCSELASPGDIEKLRTLNEADVHWLEEQIDAHESELAPLQNFVLPGGSAVAASLHVCRTVCRRAERRCVTLRRLEPETRPLVVTFLNRLSDLLFVLARVANHRAGKQDHVWHHRPRPS